MDRSDKPDYEVRLGDVTRARFADSQVQTQYNFVESFIAIARDVYGDVLINMFNPVALNECFKVKVTLNRVYPQAQRILLLQFPSVEMKIKRGGLVHVWYIPYQQKRDARCCNIITGLFCMAFFIICIMAALSILMPYGFSFSL